MVSGSGAVILRLDDSSRVAGEVSSVDGTRNAPTKDVSDASEWPLRCDRKAIVAYTFPPGGAIAARRMMTIHV